MMGDFFVIEDTMTGSNCYGLAEEGHVLVIDPNDAGRLRKICMENGWIPEIILLTHEHCDHMQGLNGIREMYDITLIATEACSRNLQKPVKNMSALMGAYMHFRNPDICLENYPRIVCGKADITFSADYDLEWRGHRLHLHAAPGHTEGSCCIFLDEKNLFTGDYMIPGEEDLTRFPGGSDEDYQRITKPWLDSLPKTLHIYPGHGKDYDLNDV